MHKQSKMAANTLLKFAVIASGVCTLVVLAIVAVVFSLIFLDDEKAMEFRSNITDNVAAPLGRIAVESTNNVIGVINLVSASMNTILGPQQRFFRDYTLPNISTSVPRNDWGLKLHVGQTLFGLAKKLRCLPDNR